MRPGRIDRVIYIPLPDSDARERIFEIHTSKIKSFFEEKITLEYLTELSEGYSGAEIAQVCKEAVMNAMNRDIDFDVITVSDFEDAFSSVKPRISKETIEFYENFKSVSSFIV